MYDQLRIYIAEGVTFNNYDLQWMIVEGTYTEETLPSYEQYGAMPSMEFQSTPEATTGLQKIYFRGKNYIQFPYKDNDYKAVQGIEYKVLNDKSIQVSGTATGDAADFYIFGTRTDEGKYLYFPKGDYSFYKSLVSGTKYVAREKTLGTLFRTANILDALKNQDCYFYSLFIRVDEGTTVDGIIYPLLSYGEEQQYVQYNGKDFTLDLGNIEMYKIKDKNGGVVAQDRLVLRDVDEVKKWQIERKVGKLVSTNAEGFITNGTGEYTYNFATPALNVLSATSYQKLYVRSNIMLTSDGNSTGFFGSTTAKRIRMNIEKKYLNEGSTTALQELFRKLDESGNTFTMYYPLATAEYEDCSAELSAQLDELYNLQLERGVNNIFVESENGVTAEIQLEYMQDLQSRLNNIEAIALEANS